MVPPKESLPVVGELAVGCDQLGGHGWSGIDANEAGRAIAAAFDAGIRMFDTADIYGLGASESRLAEVLGEGRYSAEICTKVGLRHDPRTGAVRRDGTPAYLRDAVDASRRRLRLERLPIVLLHWPDPSVAVEESLNALEELQDRGVIGAVGLANSPDVPSYACIAWRQEHRSLLTGRPTRSASAAGRGALMAYGCLEQGLLVATPRAASRLDPGDRRHLLPAWSVPAQAELAGLRETLAATAAACGLTPAQCAVRWVLSATDADVAVVGVHCMRHVEELTALRDHTLPQEAADILSAAGARTRDALIALNLPAARARHG